MFRRGGDIINIKGENEQTQKYSVPEIGIKKESTCDILVLQNPNFFN